MWADAAYRAIDEARRFSTEENPTAAAAPMLAELLDQGYVASMILSIGKLTDAEASNPVKGAISLRSILKDMRRNRDLLTRELFVCHDGLPFDPAVAEADYDRRHPIMPGTQTWMPREGPDAFRISERAHADFDSLTGVSAENRQRDDVIGEKVLTDIEALLDAPDVKLCCGLRYKYVTHAADAHSRSAANLAGFEITLGQIEAAQRSLIMANQRIRRDILWSGVGHPVPTPQFDQFAHLDRAFIPSESLSTLHCWWRKHTSDRDAWVA